MTRTSATTSCCDPSSVETSSVAVPRSTPSGIATLTRKYVDSVAGTGTRLVDTRKTLPGFHFLDKRAVRHGGGHNHRADLGSGVLIKDNHIAAAGSVTAAIEAVRESAPHSVRIEVEVTTLAQINEALAAQAHVLLFDNMSPAQVQEALTLGHRVAVLDRGELVSEDTAAATAESDNPFVRELIGATGRCAR